jgi:PAS domain S-box-containing protein
VAPILVAGDEARPADAVTKTPRQTLLKTETLQNAILNSSEFAIIATDAQGIIQLFNVGAERLLGYPASEVVNTIAPSDIHDPQEVIARAEGLSVEFATTIAPGFDALAFRASRGIVDKYELTYIRKDGFRFPAQVSITALRDERAEIIGYLLIGADNSAAQLAIAAAAREKIAEQMFHQAVESCPSGMAMIDRNGKIVMINTETERLFGYRRDELIGRSVDTLLPLHLCNQHARHRDSFTLHPEARRMGAGRDLFGLRKDGSEFPVEVALNPIQANGALHVLSVIVDISERKRLDRLKDEFVSTVSHELRTPLTSISGSLGLLVGGAAGKLPDAAARLLKIAQTNSQRLVRIVDDILNIEKLESSQVAFEFKPVETRALVEQAIEGNRGFADSYGVWVWLDPSSTGGEVHADPGRLVQVVTNLLSNAIKFSPPNSEVVVAIHAHADAIRVSVRDHGPGIPADFRRHIFEKFAQADATDAGRRSGTGLGLSIVKQIVTRLGGTVSFDDAPGGGTVFHVDLPGRDQVAEREIDRGGNPAADRILLCADDPQAAIAVREGLQQFGFATDFAHARADAILRVAAAYYCAIVIDLELPDGDGIGLIHELRTPPQNCATPIIVMSADRSRHHDALTSLEPDALEWLDKPVDISRLAQILDRIVVREANGPPKPLHVEGHPDVPDVVVA